MSEAESVESTTTLVPNQLAALVPTFDPAQDDIREYTKKVELLQGMWPDNKWTELCTRLILGCKGTAVQKLQMHSTEVTKNEKKSVQKIIELLGGHWGQVPLERKYEAFERALYRCQQKSDESHDSFLARADVMWQELLSKNLQLADLQAYVTLRGSTLSTEDKKRVVMESEASTDGKLTLPAVQKAVRMLGAGFFHEVISGRRSTGKLKTYDQATLVAEGDDIEESEQAVLFSDNVDEKDTAIADALMQEGDEDAVLVADFESAATDVLQSDEDLALAFNAYSEARRRLNEKVRHRGFWPINKGKSKGGSKSGVKGKFHKGHSSSRKSLQQRILESQCRICHQYGHWKAECPKRQDASSTSGSRPAAQAPTSYVQVTSSTEQTDALGLEFLQLPIHAETPIDVTQPASIYHSMCTATPVNQPKSQSPTMQQLYRTLNNMNELVKDSKSQLQYSLNQWNQQSQIDNPSKSVCHRLDSVVPHVIADQAQPEHRTDDESAEAVSESLACFASHSSFGVVDLGATKTVIGSKLVPELLQNLDPEVKRQVTRCKCPVTFRFGNQGVLQSEQAIVLPIGNLKLKIAVVPGSTPLLLSNTLLRALSVVIDTENHWIMSHKLKHKVPLTLTDRSLFLLDVNQLVQSAKSNQFSKPAETHVTLSQTEPSDVSEKTLLQPPAAATSDVQTSEAKLEPRVNDVPTSSHALESPQDQAHDRASSDHQCDSRHVVVGESIAAAAEGTDQCGREAGLLSSLPRGTGQSEDQFRPHPHRSNLQLHVDSRTELDAMVCPTLQQVPEKRASDPSSLHRTHGGALRVDRNIDDHDINKQRKDSGDAEGQGHFWLSDPHVQGQSQVHASTGVDVGGRGRTPLDRNRSTASSHPDTDRGECASAAGSYAEHGKCSHSSDRLHRADPEHPCSGEQRALSENECPSISAEIQAGDVSAECHFTSDFAVHVNIENQRLRSLVQTFEKELY